MLTIYATICIDWYLIWIKYLCCNVVIHNVFYLEVFTIYLVLLMKQHACQNVMSKTESVYGHMLYSRDLSFDI